MTIDYSIFDREACDNITVEVIADSLGLHRLTTFVCEFPRWCLAEVNTHRMLSRSVASSRAIPIPKMIQMTMDKPAMPVFWGRNQKGMQATTSLSPEEIVLAKAKWLKARDNAIISALELSDIGLHKQNVNRLLEPWFYVRAIISGTDFENFFALRAHKDAQPEFQVLAAKMLEAYNASTPKRLKAGEWHVPFGDKIDVDRIVADGLAESTTDESIPELIRKIATARCARVSYFNFEGQDSYLKDVATCDKLFGSVPRHLSPAEHVAQCTGDAEQIGNFRGFRQYRKFFAQENLTDARVLIK